MILRVGAILEPTFTPLFSTLPRRTPFLADDAPVFDPDDPMPKLVMPESAAVDMPLSRRLTQKAQRSGQTVCASSC